MATGAAWRSVQAADEPPDRRPLDVEDLTDALVRAGGLWRELVGVPQTASTNAHVAEAAHRGAAEGLVVTAEYQSRGRGRLDRGWQSPPGAGLTVSVLLRPEQVAISRWPWLPLLTGVAVAEATGRIAAVEIGLKWPNDVLVGGRKLAGILLERVGGSSAPAAVVGIGLNVTTTVEELVGPSATSLLLEGATTYDRPTVLRAVLSALEGWYVGWRSVGGDPDASGLRAAYESRSVTLGREVRVELPGRTWLTGTAEAVDDAGRLVVRDKTRRDTAVAAGDVIHLR